MDITTLVPSAFREHPHAVTRHLYFWEKPGHITCIFQTHPRSPGDPLRLKAIPIELERCEENTRRMAKTIYGMSYVLAGEGRITYTRERKTFALQPGAFFQYTGHRLPEIVFEVEPGFFECSACVDGDTGDHLNALSMWNRDCLCERIGLRSAVIQAYLGLFEAIGDPVMQPRSLLRRFVELAELIAGIMERDHPERAFREEARALLAANTNPSFRMQEAARRMGLTYEAFRQRFRRLFAISPQEFQLRLRMEKACALLQNKSVKETAVALGYEDQFVFSRQFKKRMGVAPKRYRPMVEPRTGQPDADG